MLLSTYVVDIISTYSNMRRCYILAGVIAIYMIVADVNTTKADVIAFCIIYGVG